MEKEFFIINIMGKSIFFYWLMDGENIEYIDFRIIMIEREYRKFID